jgi:hypothetical protein
VQSQFEPLGTESPNATSDQVSPGGVEPTAGDGVEPTVGDGVEPTADGPPEVQPSNIADANATTA